MPTAANASLISTRVRSATAMPAFLQAALIALAGCSCSDESGPATTPCAPISASQASPRRSASALSITTTAAAPSEIGEADPAVMVPSGPERRAQLAKHLDRGVRPDTLVGVDHHLALAAGASLTGSISSAK